MAKRVDADGNKIAFASISIKNSQVGTQCDGDGKFELMAPPNSTLVFSALGYRSKEIALNVETKSLLVTFQKDDIALSGDIMVGYTVRKKSKPIPAIEKVIDTAFKKFSVLHPNPVHGNTYLHIYIKKLKAGNYKISIINLSGEIIQTDERDVDENKIATLLLNNVAAGTYFICLFNEKTTASYSQKIIVQ